VLPLLPNRPMAPFGALNPHAIWIIVLLVMAIGALGHIAVRLAGSVFRLGLPSFFASRQNSGGVDEHGRAFSAKSAIVFAAMLMIVLLIQKPPTNGSANLVLRSRHW
jgi:uncharacterized membrane protein (DUF4010 family)